MSGKVEMSAGELRSVVSAHHLTVYWAGPTDGAKYALNTTTSYRVIATYVLKNAFLITQSAGAVIGNVGFTNVYMGIKGMKASYFFIRLPYSSASCPP